MNKITDAQREQIEQKFWENSEHESPESDSIENIVSKMSECAVFLSILNKYGCHFDDNEKVLELGGGQGWASCALKRLYPKLHIVLTDISKYAIQSLHKWEHIFRVKLDGSYPCTTYEINEPDSSLDTVFCFAAAHHFTHFEKTMREIRRVLKPNGNCFFFHEPTCNRFMHTFAYYRVNKNRPDVPEDVLVYKDLINQAEKIGFKSKIDFNPTLIKRGPAETIYFFILSKISFLQKILPCTANFHFQKINKAL